MSVIRTERARHTVRIAGDLRPAPRAADVCRFGSPGNTRFAPNALVFAGILPAVCLFLLLLFLFLSTTPAEAAGAPRPGADADGNGVEDVLDDWLAGREDWAGLRAASLRAQDPALRMEAESADKSFPAGVVPSPGPWSAGEVRVILIGASGGGRSARAAAQAAGRCRTLHEMSRFGGVTVVAADEAGLAALLRSDPGGRVLLDREGTPALSVSRHLAGADQAAEGHWTVGEDWSASVAILDSGCDTAHGDLGDFLGDNVDGPPPAVGDPTDWWSAEDGWPVSDRYQVVGWQDVTDDFPEARGPWDYHHHGTALASVVAGSGLIDPAYRGMAPATRLTIVKFYDFDDTWHAWAGDFLAACDWTLEHRDLYRVRTVLAAVNWEVDAGISEAMEAFLDAGVLPVAAMGNFGPAAGTGGYPASVPGVLTAGAVNDAGAVAAYSGRGTPGGTKPDLVAPGGGLLAEAGRITACDNEPDDSYSGRVGTSLAAAHVAGAVALLDEALRKSGLEVPDGRIGAVTRKAILKTTCARVVEVETADGTGVESLPPADGPDAERGWGLLRADAAIDGTLAPLLPGQNLIDYIPAQWSRPVIARRLVLQAGVTYLIEAEPATGLDVTLELAHPAWLEDPAQRDRCVLRNDNGPGVSEFAYFTPEENQLLIATVKRESGQGTVVLEVKEFDAFTESGGQATLPGPLSAAPNTGVLSGQTEPSLVIPSLVNVDQSARSINVLDRFGVSLTNWPVFVFPYSSAEGGLTQPLVWDFDGLPGDEIVIASEYGSLYFFEGNALWQVVDLGLNLDLTAPVGWVNTLGVPHVTTVDRLGMTYAYSLGPVQAWSRDLDESFPLQPAVGQIEGSETEEVAVSFRSGRVFVLDEMGNDVPGWPVDLGAVLTIPPVLCDVDEDGLHEVIQPILDAAGSLTVRVLGAHGEPAPGDGMTIAPAGGGSWLSLSPPAIAGRYGAGDLRVTLAGLHTNGLTGEATRWGLSWAEAYAGGAASAKPIEGFSVRGTVETGALEVESALLAAPLCWNAFGGTGTEPHALAQVDWQEVLYGLTTVPGAVCGWFSETLDTCPLSGRQDTRPGGPALERVSSLGSMLVPLENGIGLRVDVLGDEVTFLPVLTGMGGEPVWSAARADGRNSGAYPLAGDRTAVAETVIPLRGLSAFPNPGSGRFQLAWEGPATDADAVWEVFDLRGRLVRRLRSEAGSRSVMWDATDGAGRPVAAGSYFVRARSGPVVSTTRVLLQR